VKDVIENMYFKAQLAKINSCTHVAFCFYRFKLKFFITLLFFLARKLTAVKMITHANFLVLSVAYIFKDLKFQILNS